MFVLFIFNTNSGNIFTRSVIFCYCDKQSNFYVVISYAQSLKGLFY